MSSVPAPPFRWSFPSPPVRVSLPSSAVIVSPRGLPTRTSSPSATEQAARGGTCLEPIVPAAAGDARNRPQHVVALAGGAVVGDGRSGGPSRRPCGPHRSRPRPGSRWRPAGPHPDPPERVEKAPPVWIWSSPGPPSTDPPTPEVSESSPSPSATSTPSKRPRQKRPPPLVRRAAGAGERGAGVGGRRRRAGAAPPRSRCAHRAVR